MIHLYTYSLPAALRLVLAGEDTCGEPKAFAVTARRQISGKCFRTDSQFRPFRPLGASTQAVRNVPHSFALRKFRIPHETLGLRIRMHSEF